MTAELEHSQVQTNAEPCSVVVLYEDTLARDRAMAMCDHVIPQLWTEMEFKLDWWRFAYLTHAQFAKEAARAVEAADVIIVSARPAGDLSAHFMAWVESRLESRAGRTGALIDLVGPPESRNSPESDLGLWTLDSGLSGSHGRLRVLARRAGMDYLSPLSHTGTIPDSIEAVTRRAGQVTSVLEEILHHKSPPLN